MPLKRNPASRPQAGPLAGLAIIGLLAATSSCEKHGQPFVPTRPNQIDSTKVDGREEGRWVKRKSPYYVVDDVTVPRGRTLTIEPGVVVVVIEKGLNINVEGTLIAVGKPDSTIIFRPTSTTSVNPLPGDWGSLVFRSSRGNRLEHVRVAFATTGITATDSDFSFRNVVFVNQQFDALALERCAATFIDCTIANNGQYGLSLQECDNPPYEIRFEHCNIGNNVYGGIWAVNSSVNAFRSDIKNNGRSGDVFNEAFSAGVHFEGSPGLRLPIFTMCNLENNQPCDVRNIMGEGLFVVADSVYWGITTREHMNALSNLQNPNMPNKRVCSFNVPAICDALDSLGTSASVTFCYWRDEPWCNFPPYFDAPASCPQPAASPAVWGRVRARVR